MRRLGTTGSSGAFLISAKAVTFLLFPLPSHLPKRNSVRQVDAALQTGALSIIALGLRTIDGAASRGFARHTPKSSRAFPF